MTKSARGFPPVIDANIETLILGSFPSVASLGKAQYYGHPQNQFWRLVGAVIAEPLPEMEYAQRLKTLLEAPHRPVGRHRYLPARGQSRFQYSQPGAQRLFARDRRREKIAPRMLQRQDRRHNGGAVLPSGALQPSCCRRRALRTQCASKKSSSSGGKSPRPRGCHSNRHVLRACSLAFDPSLIHPSRTPC